MCDKRIKDFRGSSNFSTAVTRSIPPELPRPRNEPDPAALHAMDRERGKGARKPSSEPTRAFREQKYLVTTTAYHRKLYHRRNDITRRVTIYRVDAACTRLAYTYARTTTVSTGRYLHRGSRSFSRRKSRPVPGNLRVTTIMYLYTYT